MSIPVQERHDTRTRILEATADCISSDGIAALRMVTIAKAAGVSTALLHYHFATKERLFEEVLRHSYQSSTVLDQESLRGAGRSPAQRLAAYLDRCLPSDDDLARDWLLWQELALMCLRQPELAAVSADLYQGDHERVAEIIRDGVADGSFDGCDADAVAQAAVALCDGLGTRVLSDDPRTTLADARRIVATTVGVLVGSGSPLPMPGVGARRRARA
jgi:AcrR family transcriptional regulator